MNQEALSSRKRPRTAVVVEPVEGQFDDGEDEPDTGDTLPQTPKPHHGPTAAPPVLSRLMRLPFLLHGDLLDFLSTKLPRKRSLSSIPLSIHSGPLTPSQLGRARLALLGEASASDWEPVALEMLRAASVPYFSSSLNVPRKLGALVKDFAGSQCILVDYVPAGLEADFQRLLSRVAYYCCWKEGPAVADAVFGGEAGPEPPAAPGELVLGPDQTAALTMILAKYEPQHYVVKLNKIVKAVEDGTARLVVLEAETAGSLTTALRFTKLYRQCHAQGIWCLLASKLGVAAACVTRLQPEDEAVVQSLVSGGDESTTVEAEAPINGVHETGRTVTASSNGAEQGGDVVESKESRESEATDHGTDLAESMDLSTEDSESLVALEERVWLLETITETLHRRQQVIEEDLQVATSKKARSLERCNLLSTRVKQLQEALDKQSTLHDELVQSLDKSQSYLRRLESTETDDMSMKDIEEMAQAHDNLESTMKDEARALGDNGHSSAYEVDHSSGASDKSNRWDALYKGSRDDVPVANAFILFPLNNTLSRMTSFWKSGMPISRRLAPFLPNLQSQNLLSIQEVCCRSILTADARDRSGRHRYEALWGTCLDFRTMASISASHPLVTVARDDNKSNGANGLVGRIDPNIALCPYELAGVCADPACSFQHLEKRDVGPVLPRELLPLPPLRLRGKTRRPTGKRAAVDPRLSAKPSNTDPARSHSLGQSSSAAAISENKDFVALPSVTLSDGSEGESTADFSNDETSQSVGASWKDEQHMANTTARCSFYDLLESLGCPLVRREKGELSTASLGSPTSAADGALFCGKVVDMCRLAVHAGRFDVAYSLDKHSMNVTGQWVSDQRQAVGCFTRCCCDMLQFASRTIDHSFANEAGSSKNAFQVAFECQAKLAVTSFAMHELHGSMLGQSNGDHSEMQQWGRVVEKLLARFLAEPGLEYSIGDATITCHSLGGSELVSTARTRVQGMGEDIEHALGAALYIATVSPLSALVERVLDPLWRAGTDLLDQAESASSNSGSLLLGVTVQLGYSVLAILSRAADHSQVAVSNDTAKSELTELYTTIDMILMSLSCRAARQCSLDTLLAPLFAANIALATSLRLYDRAQNRLESLLSPERPQSTSFHLSELLWSQLLQLRMSLPFSPSNSLEENAGFVLPAIVHESNTMLTKAVTDLALYPHHLSLPGDWNLVRELNIEVAEHDDSTVHDRVQLQQECFQIVESLQVTTPGQLTFSFQGRPLMLRSSYGEPSAAVSPFPSSLLLAGHSIAQLLLNSCELRHLPDHFGYYFPQLKVLELKHNALSELPSSALLLYKLEVLCVDSNHLQCLPTPLSRLSHLHKLTVADNELVALDVYDCKRLQVLDIRDNAALQIDSGRLVQALPELREFEWSGCL